MANLEKSPPGALCIVLHSHLPYVLGHGHWPHGTDWLHEAAAETYIPLLQACDRLIADGLSPNLTIGITPVLGEMLSHETFSEVFVAYLKQKAAAADQDAGEFATTGQEDFARLAARWSAHFSHLLDAFENRYGRDLVGAFRRLQDEGHIEIITCAATHGYLPLLSRDESIQGQLATGVATTKRLFGKPPRGIWLPECAYRPGYDWASPTDPDAPKVYRRGIETWLSEQHLDWFVVDNHLLRGGKPVGVYIDRFEALKRLWDAYESSADYRPVDRDLTAHEPHLLDAGENRKPVAFVTRDPDTGVQVWSGDSGYPGEGHYLDFHKKRWPGGHRYWRVTRAKTDLADKEIYQPEEAAQRIGGHAEHFAGLCLDILRGDTHGTLLCAPYDTELFGHWWFEGPRFLEALVRAAAVKGLRMATVSDAMAANPPERIVSLPEGSWGEGGHHYIWLNEWNAWTWKHVYECEDSFAALVRDHADTGDALLRRVLEQAARELLLLQSSDWQFLISTWSARDYAETRFTFHVEAYRRLAALAHKQIDGEGLTEADLNYVDKLEKQDSIFRDIDLGRWRVGD